MAFPQSVLSTKVEIWYDSAWHDITDDVRGTGATDGEIEIDPRGQPNESTGLTVAQAALSVNNRNGKYSPRNFLSPLYGKIGMNTPLRIITDIGDTTNVEDDFSTNGTNGWPVADSGHTWVSTGGAAADYLTTGGEAYHRHTATNTMHTSAITTVDVIDFDFVIQGIKLEAAPTPGGNGVTVSVRGRVSNAGADYVEAQFYFSSGFVAIEIRQSADGVLTDVASGTLAGGILDSDTVNMRFRTIGRDLYLRGWETGTTEPTTWDVTGTTDVIEPGSIELKSILGFSVTNPLPFDVTFQSVAVSLGIIMFTGEIAEFPKKWDKTGNDVWVPLQASGITRRLNQGEKPIGSPLFRHYKRMTDLVAYWSLENLEGARNAYPTIASDLDADDAQAMVAYNPNPFGDADIKWSGESTLLGSDPLPLVELGASTFGNMAYGQCNFVSADAANDSFTVSFWNYVPLRNDIATSNASVSVVVDMVNENPIKTYQFFVSQGTTGGVPYADVSMYAYTADLTLVMSVVETPFTYQAAWRYFLFHVRIIAGVAYMTAYVDGVEIDFNNAAATTIGQPREFNNISAFQLAVNTTEVPNAVGHLAIASGQGGTDLKTANEDTTAIGREAYQGELATDRLTRLFAEEGITFELDQGGTLTDPDPGTALGPQKSMTIMALAQQAAQADDGILYEMREDFGYRYRSRWALYNRDSALTLDYTNTDLGEVPETTDDDQRLRNKITIKRDGGSGASTVEQTTGPLSTNDPRAAIPGAGTYDDEPSGISLATDEQQADYAGWRLNLGTWDESRFPGVSVALHRAPFINNKAKLAAAALLDVGEILTIQNPPAWLSPGDVVLQMRSVKIFLSNFNWNIEWACLPGGPWQNVATASAELGRADMDSSVLASAVDSDDTDLVVYTNETDLPWSDPLWTEDPGELSILGAQGIDLRLNPPTLAGGLGGERVRVPLAKTIEDTFTRSGQLSGSSANTGQTWVNTSGTAADATTDGTSAILAHPSANTLLHQSLPGTHADMTAQVDIRFNVASATGASVFATFVFRQTDASNFYAVVFELAVSRPTETLVYLRKVVAGVATNIISHAIPHASASVVHRTKVTIYNRDFLVKIWDPATEVEGDFTYTLRGSASDLLTGNDIAIRSTRQTGNTQNSFAVYWDNLTVVAPKIRPVTYDRFARTVVNGLGSATTGETWTNRSSGGVISASDWQVTPNQASTTIPAASASRGGELLTTNYQDVCVSLLWTAPLATGATMSQFIGVRATSGSFVYGYVDINTNNTLTLVIGSTLNGLLAFKTLDGVTHSATQAMRSKVAVMGDQLMMKCWAATGNEPDYWYLQGTLADPIISGWVLFQNSRAPGNTNVNPAITVADFRIDNPQKITVQRGMDGSSRAWDAGTDVRLWTPARAGR